MEVDPRQGSGCRPVTHPSLITVPAITLATLLLRTALADVLGLPFGRRPR
jgi:hypothetical protein